MPMKFKDVLPENDYAGWLLFGLILLLINQFIATKSGGWVPVVRWLLLLAAAVNYGIVLYRYDRDRRAKQQKKAAEGGDEKPKNLKS